MNNLLAGIRRGFVLLILALLPAWISAAKHPHRSDWLKAAVPDPWSVGRSVAESWGSALWIDARSPADFAQGHYPGATQLSDETFESQFGEVMRICKPGGCEASKSMAKRLREAGFLEVYVLAEGWP
jgi:hypothetical protein